MHISKQCYYKFDFTLTIVTGDIKWLGWDCEGKLVTIRQLDYVDLNGC